MPEQLRYEWAIEMIPNVKVLSDTSTEQARNLLSERRRQLERRRYFYQDVLQKKVKEMKVRSKELDSLTEAIGKRQKRIDEMKEHLSELKTNNHQEEVRK